MTEGIAIRSRRPQSLRQIPGYSATNPVTPFLDSLSYIKERTFGQMGQIELTVT
jgi:hypothetical protein